MGRLIIVSNRLPVTVTLPEGAAGADGGVVEVARSTGGLATGLSGPHQESGGLWVGWPGDTTELSSGQRDQVERQLADLRLVPVHLTREEVAGYYEGFSNRVLWPLFHYLLDHLPLETMQWELYRMVNERFADAVAAHARPGDTIWVHDYQLCLVPGLLRRKLPEARIGFFLHIPFPCSEVVQALPWRDDLLRGLLGADLIGFHTYLYARRFLGAVLRLLCLPAERDQIIDRGRVIQVGAYPMGVDAATISESAARPEVAARAEEIRREAGAGKILLGIDRLDYTKGIRRRLLALEHLLEESPDLRGRVKLIQVAVPSRTTISEYEHFRQEVDEVVGRVNGAFATAGWVPVHYLYRALSMPELVALYRAADLMLVTPLRDGMNLVAKEFVASRVDGRGVLLLSELAGAAAELGQALLVNPYDVDGLGQAIRRGLSMSEHEQALRMGQMRARVRSWDVHHWVRTFLGDLESAGERGPARLGYTSADQLARLQDRVAGAERRALLLDCDGTLLDFHPVPDMVAPDDQLRRVVAALARAPGTWVHLVSGRPAETLERWFGDLPVSLHAEHGLYWRREGGPWQQEGAADPSWKGQVRPLLDQVALTTPGSFVEEKRASLAWHYRMADPELVEGRLAQLKALLGARADLADLEILQGDQVVEVRQRGVNKGLVVPRALALAGPDALMVAIGDDRTDEDLFAALPPGAIAVHVGPRESCAPYRLPSVAAARSFLEALTASSSASLHSP
jgi:trehalose 6-phosphate synthase/phosphatase